MEVLDVIQISVGRSLEFEKANERRRKGRETQQHSSRWQAPPEGTIKINSDAAILKNKAVGMGGIARDHVGEVVMATCRNKEGSFAVEVAEAMSLCHALKIAMEAGFNTFILETDNLQLFTHLNRRLTPSSYFGRIVKDIIVLGSQCVSVVFSFVKREGNQAAHLLAKMSENVRDELVWLEEYPPDIGWAILEDLQHMTA